MENIIEVAALQQQRKKRLSTIFRFLWRAAFSPNEAVNRSPIRVTEFFQRCLCGWCGTLRLQHYAPIGRSERHRAVSNAQVTLYLSLPTIISRHIIILAKLLLYNQVTTAALALAGRERLAPLE